MAVDKVCDSASDTLVLIVFGEKVSAGVACVANEVVTSQCLNAGSNFKHQVAWLSISLDLVIYSTSHSVSV